MTIGDSLTCRRCGWVWHSRVDRKPAQCPRCHSPIWDRPLTVPKVVVR